MNDRLTILQGDALTVLKTLPDESVQCCVTSPPYWGLRDYGVKGQLGLEKTPEEYVGKMVEVFREVRRVLREDGVLFLNLGDSYWGGGNYRGLNSENTLSEKQRSNRGATGVCEELGAVGKTTGLGLKPKDLCGIPWRLAFALQADGWWLRQDIIWHKPNPMPESVTDRCTKAHEYIFLLTKSARYFYDAEAIKEPSETNGECRGGGYKYLPDEINDQHSRAGLVALGNRPCNPTRNKRSVWTVATDPYSEAHFATFPPDLIKPCILAGTSAKGACPKCGAPWERVVEDTPEYAQFKANETERKGGGMGSSTLETMGLTRGSSNKSVTSDKQTTGWKPTCDCGLTETVPCTICDPFFGSGTTGMVSLELGRKCIGIELNEDYIKLAEDRCNVTPGLALA